MLKTFNHYNLIFPIILLIICYCIFGVNIDNFPFLDTDETRFVSIAQEMLNDNDWINTKLNGEVVYNYPPLLFWLINLSCLIFGKISGFTVRLPNLIISTVGILSLYFVIRNLLQKQCATIMSLIFALSFGILIFSRLATNDIISTFSIIMTLLSSYLLILDKNKISQKLLWSYIFFFCALAILSSGLFGFLIPFFSITAMLIFAGRSKELLKLPNMIIGICIFLITILPWNTIMFHKYGMLFLKENLTLYNPFNYFNIKNIIEVIGLFILGFMPWSFSFLWILTSKAKGIVNSFFSYFKDNSEEKLNAKWKKLKLSEKFLSLNTIVFFTTLTFALFFGSKYTFLILLLILPASCISGFHWYQYITKKKHDKSIFVSTLIPALTLIICSLIGLFGHNALNKWLFHGLNNLIIPLVVLFFIIPVISIFAVILKGRLIAFLSNIILMFSLSFVITPSIFNFIIAKNGESDLIKFAQKASDEDVKLTAFIPSKKYSLVYYYDKPIQFKKNNDYESLKEYLKENKTNYAVVEIKDLSAIEKNNIKYMLIDAGKRYSLIQFLPYELQKLEDKKEPEIIIK